MRVSKSNTHRIIVLNAYPIRNVLSKPALYILFFLLEDSVTSNQIKLVTLTLLYFF